MRGINLLFLAALAVLGYMVWQNRKAVVPSNAAVPPPNLPAAQPGTPGGVDPNVAAVTGAIADLVGKGLAAAFAAGKNPPQVNPTSTGVPTGYDAATGIPWAPA